MGWKNSFGAASPAVMGLALLGLAMIGSSAGVLGAWLGMEVGFVGSLPLLMDYSLGEVEGAMKYFVVQSLGSMVLLLGFVGLASWHVVPWSWSGWGEVLVFVGMLVKVGVFPGHFWVPAVVGEVGWFGCVWVGFVYKLGGLWVFCGLGIAGVLREMMACCLVLTSIVGALGGLGQTSVRGLVAYSSLVQTGWMGVLGLVDCGLMVLYGVGYGVGLVCVVCGSCLVGVDKMAMAGSRSSGSGAWLWLSWLGGFFSLSGVPPFLGFGIKLWASVVLVGSASMVLCGLLLSASISLYYYLSFFVNFFVGFGLRENGWGFSVGDMVCFGALPKMAFLIMIGAVNWVGGWLMVLGVLLI